VQRIVDNNFIRRKRITTKRKMDQFPRKVASSPLPLSLLGALERMGAILFR
jgi:hypothetical protein